MSFNGVVYLGGPLLFVSRSVIGSLLMVCDVLSLLLSVPVSHYFGGS